MRDVRNQNIAITTMRRIHHIIIGLFIFLCVYPTSGICAPGVQWKTVAQTTKRDPSYNPFPVKVKGEQALLNTQSLGDISWWGYSGPTNIHTRRLSFSTNGKSYDIPDEFTNDLLDLHINRPSHISIDGDNTVLTMSGCSGEKAYTVHFHFQGERLVQRILVYSEARDIYIKQNS